MTVNHQSVKAEDVFTLNMISKDLSVYLPPRQPFDAAGSWRNCYDVLTLVHGFGHKVGTIEIERKINFPDTVLLEIHYQLQLLGNYQHKIDAAIEGTNDMPVQATGWRFSSVSLDPAGNEISHTRIRRKAEIVNDTMVISGSGSRRTIRLSRPYLVGWSILEWVQRIGPDFRESAEFTLVADYDQVKPGGKLIFEGQERIYFGDPAAGEACPMRCYVQTGQGVLPAAYWVDEFSRCLFVVSGIEAYILRS